MLDTADEFEKLLEIADKYKDELKFLCNVRAMTHKLRIKGDYFYWVDQVGNYSIDSIPIYKINIMVNLKIIDGYPTDELNVATAVIMLAHGGDPRIDLSVPGGRNGTLLTPSPSYLFKIKAIACYHLRDCIIQKDYGCDWHGYITVWDAHS